MNVFDVLTRNGYICNIELGYCYNPKTGSLCKVREQEPAYYTSRDRDESRQLKINGSCKPVTHVVYYIMNEVWPTSLIDHKDQNVYNIEWENLRAATYTENNRNRQLVGRTSYVGDFLEVGVQKFRNKYRVLICGITYLWTEDRLEANAFAKQKRTEIYGAFLPKSEQTIRRRV